MAAMLPRRPVMQTDRPATTLITALFNDHAAARTAIAELREAGVTNEALSLIGREADDTTDSIATGEPGDPDTADNAHVARGAIGGGALGALLGVGAVALIPGAGPFLAIGAIGSGLAAAMTTGAVIGAGVGGLGEVLHDRGVDPEDSAYYEERLAGGAVMVAVDADMTSISADQIDDLLMRNGGHRASPARQRILEEQAAQTTI